MIRSNKFSNMWFYVCLALLPVAYIPGFGTGYLEPKRILLFFTCLGCLYSLIKKLLLSSGDFVVNGYIWGVFAIVLIRLTSIFPLYNPGFQLDSVNASICMLIVGLYVVNTELRPDLLGKAMFLPVCLVLAGAFLKILFGVSFFTQPYGILVHLKNGVAIFLVAAVPFLLVAFPDFWNQPNEPKGKSRNLAILLVLVTLIFWAALSYRTRSSWWMIFSYFAGMLLIYHQTHLAASRKALLLMLIAATSAVILLKVVPNVMVWKSGTPYLDSLTTMASLENSSGRKEFWKVALHMIRSHPWRGVGTGGFAPQWVAYIPGSGAEAKVFELQVRASPALNDYLHMTAELGIIPGLVFSWVVLGLPLLYFCRLIGQRDIRNGPALLLCLGSLALALDSMFDFVFIRPEAYILHAVALNFASKNCGTTAYPGTRGTKIVAIIGAAVFSIFLLINISFMGVGLLAKKLWSDRKELHQLEIALQYWPWDSSWSHKHLEAMLAAGRMDLAEKYAEKFSRAWPNDAEAALIRAKLYEAKGDYPNALVAYRRAVVKIPGGRCHKPGFENYKIMIARPEFVREPVLRLTMDDLATCVK